MPEYRVNDSAVRQARQLIDDGRFDDRTEWSDAAPDAAAADDVFEREGFDAFAACTWPRTRAPRRAPRAATRSRTANGLLQGPATSLRVVGQWILPHDAIERVADDLLQRLDAHREG